MRTTLGLILASVVGWSVCSADVVSGVEDVRKILDENRRADAAERIESLIRALRALHNPRKFPDRNEVASLLEETESELFSIPGHAEQLGEKIKERRDAAFADAKNRRAYWSYAQYAFSVLELMPSDECVRVLAGFVHDTEALSEDVSTGGPSTPGHHSRKVLRTILSNPPTKSLYADEVWLKWRDDLKAGNASYRFQGSTSRYSWNGPLDERIGPGGGLSSRGGTGNSASKSDVAATGDSGRFLGVLLALSLLSFAVIWLIVRTRTAKGSEER